MMKMTILWPTLPSPTDHGTPELSPILKLMLGDTPTRFACRSRLDHRPQGEESSVIVSSDSSVTGRLHTSIVVYVTLGSDL